MSKPNETATILDETFATKLGIEMVTPRVFEELIQINAGSKNVVCAIGPSGVGKTAVPGQVAARRNGGKGVPYAQVHMPTASQEGFFIPTTAADTKQYFDQRIPRTFEKVLAWAEKMTTKFKGKPVPADMCPIIVVEELNRAVDKNVTRAAFVMLGDRMIGDTKLPDCVQLVVTMNPTGGGMAVNEFEKDPAMRRRLVQIGVDYSYGDFMTYATGAGFHPSVLGHLGAQPSQGYDKLAASAGKSFACPATWEVVSRLCYMFDEAKIPLQSTTGRAAIAGTVGSATATAFLDYIRDNTLVISPEEVMTTYTETSETRRRFKAYLTEGGGRLDKVTELSRGLSVFLYTDMGRAAATVAPPLALYMNDLPADILMVFITQLHDEGNRLGNDGRTYFQDVNKALAQLPPFLAAMERLHAANQAVDAAKVES